MSLVPNMGPGQATMWKTFLGEEHSTGIVMYKEGSGILIRKDLGGYEKAQEVKAPVGKSGH